MTLSTRDRPLSFLFAVANSESKYNVEFQLQSDEYRYGLMTSIYQFCILLIIRKLRVVILVRFLFIKCVLVGFAKLKICGSR